MNTEPTPEGSAAAVALRDAMQREPFVPDVLSVIRDGPAAGVSADSLLDLAKATAYLLLSSDPALRAMGWTEKAIAACLAMTATGTELLPVDLDFGTTGPLN